MISWTSALPIAPMGALLRCPLLRGRFSPGRNCYVWEQQGPRKIEPIEVRSMLRIGQEMKLRSRSVDEGAHGEDLPKKKGKHKAQEADRSRHGAPRVRSCSPSNTRVHLQGAPQRPVAKRPHLRALSGATRCCTAGYCAAPLGIPGQGWAFTPGKARRRASQIL